MNYVVPDIHNDNDRFSRLIERINPRPEDHIFLLGDLFDRCSYNPDPVGVYFSVLSLGDKCTVVSGNHDRWLAEYIREYYGTKERKRKKLPAYYYNSFEIMTKRLTEADMLALAEWLLSLPLQYEIVVNDSKMLLAHAMTSDPTVKKDDIYYLLGEGNEDVFYKSGIEGYVSFCGHSSSSFFSRYGGEYLDGSSSIWRNDRKNLYMMDCGCGYADGKLACLCLEDMRSMYEE